MRTHASGFTLQTSNFTLVTLLLVLVSSPVLCRVSQAALKGGSAKVQSITTEIQVLRLGDVCILGLPGEALVEVGREIRKNAGMERLLIAMVANDAIGYVCHSPAYDEGGYEPESGASLAQGAGEIMGRESRALLGEVQRVN